MSISKQIGAMGSVQGAGAKPAGELARAGRMGMKRMDSLERARRLELFVRGAKDPMALAGLEGRKDVLKFLYGKTMHNTTKEAIADVLAKEVDALEEPGLLRMVVAHSTDSAARLRVVEKFSQNKEELVWIASEFAVKREVMVAAADMLAQHRLDGLDAEGLKIVAYLGSSMDKALAAVEILKGRDDDALVWVATATRNTGIGIAAVKALMGNDKALHQIILSANDEIRNAAIDLLDVHSDVLRRVISMLSIENVRVDVIKEAANRIAQGIGEIDDVPGLVHVAKKADDRCAQDLAVEKLAGMLDSINRRSFEGRDALELVRDRAKNSRDRVNAGKMLGADSEFVVELSSMLEN